MKYVLFPTRKKPEHVVCRLVCQLRLLEGTLRAERAENARMRIAASGRRDSWDDAHDGDGQGHLSARRRSTGESEGGQVRKQQQQRSIFPELSFSKKTADY